MIRKRGAKYIVIAETTGRALGTYDSLAEAEKRLRQIEFFKRIKRGAASSRRGRAR